MESKYLNNDLTRPDEHWASFQILDTVFMWVSCVEFERLVNAQPLTKTEIYGGISKKQKEKKEYSSFCFSHFKYEMVLLLY